LKYIIIVLKYDRLHSHVFHSDFVNVKYS